MTKLIGIYGGSFDPIHFGHLNLAKGIMEARGLDQVLFCPAALNPLKPKPTTASDKQRVEMIRLAIEGESRFGLTDVDLSRPGPSYTVDTLKILTDMYPDAKFALILGEDAARDFPQWRQPEEIMKMAQIFIGTRGDDHEIPESLKKGMTPTRRMDISSTEIRKRLSEGRYCGHLVPGKVLDYIFANRLYSLCKK